MAKSLVPDTKQSRESIYMTSNFPHSAIRPEDFFWALQGLCALHRKPFSPKLAQQQLAPPHTPEALCKGAQAYGLDASIRKLKIGKLRGEAFPLIAWLAPKEAGDGAHTA